MLPAVDNGTAYYVICLLLFVNITLELIGDIAHFDVMLTGILGVGNTTLWTLNGDTYFITVLNVDQL